MKQKIYIAGKITGIEDLAAERFDCVENILISEGYEVVNPMKLPHNHDKSWESYMKECITELVKCDGIYLMKGFELSKGARVEAKLASDLSIDVINSEKLDKLIEIYLP